MTLLQRTLQTMWDSGCSWLETRTRCRRGISCTLVTQTRARSQAHWAPVTRCTPRLRWSPWLRLSARRSQLHEMQPLMTRIWRNLWETTFSSLLCHILSTRNWLPSVIILAHICHLVHCKLQSTLLHPNENHIFECFTLVGISSVVFARWWGQCKENKFLIVAEGCNLYVMIIVWT